MQLNAHYWNKIYESCGLFEKKNKPIGRRVSCLASSTCQSAKMTRRGDEWFYLCSTTFVRCGGPAFFFLVIIHNSGLPDSTNLEFREKFLCTCIENFLGRGFI